MVVYPSESASSISGKDGGKLPAAFLLGCCFGGLPRGHEVGIFREGPTPSSICPIHAALGGALLTNCGVESDSLDNPCSIGWSYSSTLDLGHLLSDVAIAYHHSSFRGRRIAMK